jgi:3-oxoacyl-[acyl-carrier-protein] synthase II
MERRRVVVTGLGAITPVGNDVESTWESLLAGRSGIGPITQFDASNTKTKIAGEVKDFDPDVYFEKRESRRLDRYVQLFIGAADQAMVDSGIDLDTEPELRERMGSIAGAGMGGLHSFEESLDTLRSRGPGRLNPLTIPKLIANMSAGMAAIRWEFFGPTNCTVTACAASANAIGDAAEVIRRGAADVMMAGGAEATVSEFVIGSFNSAKALSTNNEDPEGASRPFDLNRDGFVLSEGGAVLMLEERERALARGATIHGEILGYGMSTDGFHVTLPRPGGKGQALAITAALRDAELDPSEVQHLNAHGTSTPANDKTETAAIKLAFGSSAQSLAISSTKSMTGHLLGGAGAVEALACLLAIRDQVVPPTINLHTPDPECDLDYVPNEAREMDVTTTLSNSFGFGGHNVSLILGKHQ